ncbi:hypothetical protein ABVK25_007426 [Lepraria finkii]|uniref:Uncharacterized protein n=1 Tax=Lepraria finkii TaxID=1340010 RepID=A0ABR4B2Y3_9LECA
MEDFRDLERTVTNEEELRAQTRRSREKCLEQLKTLYLWRYGWGVAHNGPVAYEVPVDPKTSWTVDENLQLICDTVLYFTDVTMADELNYYNVVLSAVLSCAHIMNIGHSPIAELVFSALPASEKPTKTNPLTMPSGNIFIYLDAAKESMRSVTTTFLMNMSAKALSH